MRGRDKSVNTQPNVQVSFRSAEPRKGQRVLKLHHSLWVELLRPLKQPSNVNIKSARPYMGIRFEPTSWQPLTDSLNLASRIDSVFVGCRFHAPSCSRFETVGLSKRIRATFRITYCQIAPHFAFQILFGNPGLLEEWREECLKRP